MTKTLMQRMQPVPMNSGFRMEGYWVWCGSVVKGEDGRYHMFAARWPKTQPSHPAWMLQSEIVRAVSDSPVGPYEFKEVVLPARGAAYWDGRSTYNPYIIHYQGTYILYYGGTTHPFDEPEPWTLTVEDPRVITARSHKRIGMAVSKSVFGPWQRLDHPIMATRPDKFDSFLQSNPAPCIHDDGSVLLIYKARAYKGAPYHGFLHGQMTMGAAYAKRYDDVYRPISDTPVFSPEQMVIEDPFIWKTSNGYELIAKDMDGRICGERYGGMHAFSEDGLHWHPQQGELAYSRNILWADGKKRMMGNMERPFILFENGEPICAFFAVSDGIHGAMDAKNSWNMAVPLVLGL